MMTGPTVPPSDPEPSTELPERVTRIAHDGVKGDITRDKVVRAVKRIMMVAHHAGLPSVALKPLLSDPAATRLARQAAHGLTPEQADLFLARMWHETWEAFQQNGFWSPQEAGRQAEAYLDANRHKLSPREQRVMDMALDIAKSTGIVMKVALPTRGLSDRSAEDGGVRISDREIGRVLQRLCDGGEFLAKVESGRPGINPNPKANTYRLTPAAFRRRAVAKGGDVQRQQASSPVAAQGNLDSLHPRTQVPRTLMRQQPMRQELGRPNLRLVDGMRQQPMRQQPMRQNVSPDGQVTCPHGITLIAPGRESEYDRIPHEWLGFDYGPECWR